jgi:hypothetical protein
MPYLLTQEYPATRYILKLPYAEQKELEGGSVDVLVPSSGGYDTLKIAVENLTKEHCKQVFQGRCLRDLAEQRAYLASREQRAKEDAVRDLVGSDERAYFISGKGNVVFTKPCELTRKELLRILEDLENDQ